MVDTSATCHSISHIEFFSTYTLSDFGSLNIKNDVESKFWVLGSIHTSNATLLIPKGVRHVFSILLNLILVGQLDDERPHNNFRMVI